jgi:hypothetical protein
MPDGRITAVGLLERHTRYRRRVRVVGRALRPGPQVFPNRPEAFSMTAAASSRAASVRQSPRKSIPVYWTNIGQSVVWNLLNH